MAPTKMLDRVCGMWIDQETAPFRSTWRGETHYFCSKACKGHFDHDRNRT